jgi:hypothetical protein
MIVTGKAEVLGQKPVGVTLSTKNLIWTGLGLNSGLCISFSCEESKFVAGLAVV